MRLDMSVAICVSRPGAKAASTVVFARRENPALCRGPRCALVPRPAAARAGSLCLRRRASRLGALRRRASGLGAGGVGRRPDSPTRTSLSSSATDRPRRYLSPRERLSPRRSQQRPALRCAAESDHHTAVCCPKRVVLRVPRTQRRDADSSLNDIPCRDSQQQQQSTQSELVATRFTAYSTAEPKSQTTQSPKLAAEPLVPCSALGRDVIDVR